MGFELLLLIYLISFIYMYMYIRFKVLYSNIIVLLYKVEKYIINIVN